MQLSISFILGGVLLFMCKILSRYERMRFQTDLPYSLNLEGVYLCHNGFEIVINSNAIIGKGTVIQNSVCIGEMDGSHKSPMIGENVFIGCHACILGDIKVGNNVKIGAGVVVIKDVPDNCTVVGVPARVI